MTRSTRSRHLAILALMGTSALALFIFSPAPPPPPANPRQPGVRVPHAAASDQVHSSARTAAAASQPPPGGRLPPFDQQQGNQQQLRLLGRVQHNDDRPTHNAHVHLLRARAQPVFIATTRSASDGAFSLSMPAPGEYILLAHLAASSGIAKKRVIVAPGRVTGSCVLRLPALVTYSGVVNSSDGSAVSGARVRVALYLPTTPEVTALPGFSSDLTATTDASGAFSFPGLMSDPRDSATGTFYRVFATHAAHEPEVVQLSHGELSDLGQHLIVLRPRFTLTLSGSISAHDGSPLTGARLSLVCSITTPDYQHRASVGAGTSRGGEFALPVTLDAEQRRCVQTESGHLILTAFHPGYQRTQTRIRLADIGHRLLSLRLSPGRIATGRVLGPRGEPISGARLVLYASGDRDPLTETTSDRLGAFQFDCLGPETYRVIASPPAKSELSPAAIEQSLTADTHGVVLRFHSRGEDG